MMNVPINAVPNQQLSIILDGNTWGITLKTVGDSTIANFTLNAVDILDGARAAAGSLIIPSQYEESGNFFFITQNFQLPYYSFFNVSQSLIYISAAELTAIRQPQTPPVTVADFNPIAALPLRFAPRGYLPA